MTKSSYLEPALYRRDVRPFCRYRPALEATLFATQYISASVRGRDHDRTSIVDVTKELRCDVPGVFYCYFTCRSESTWSTKPLAAATAQMTSNASASYSPFISLIFARNRYHTFTTLTLSQQDRDVVAKYPLDGSLDSLRDKLCETEKMPFANVASNRPQRPTSRLLGALMGHEAAYHLEPKTATESLLESF